MTFSVVISNRTLAAEHLVGLLPEVSYLCPAHNEGYVPKEALARVHAAFEQIVTGKAPFESEGDTRIHRFVGFGLVLPG